MLNEKNYKLTSNNQVSVIFMAKMCYKVTLDEMGIIWDLVNQHGSGATLDVKAIPNNIDSGRNEMLGRICVGIDGKKSATLINLYVKPAYRRQGVGSLLIDFAKSRLEGRKTECLEGDITGAENLESAISFFQKNKFGISSDKFVYTSIKKPKYPDFGFLGREVEVIRRKEFDSYY